MWTAGDIRKLLPDIVEGAAGGATRADIFMHHYGVKEQGNVDSAQVWEYEVFMRVKSFLIMLERFLATTYKKINVYVSNNEVGLNF